MGKNIDENRKKSREQDEGIIMYIKDPITGVLVRISEKQYERRLKQKQKIMKEKQKNEDSDYGI